MSRRTPEEHAAFLRTLETITAYLAALTDLTVQMGRSAGEAADAVEALAEAGRTEVAG